MSALAAALGKNIQQVRKTRGISQELLAHQTGIDRSYMSRIERGIVSITVEKLYTLALALECELSELLPPLR